MTKRMRYVIQDFEKGDYVAATSPYLPFKDGAFDLTLCSWFLLAHTEVGLQFHQQSIEELLRITDGEVLIFPISDAQGSCAGVQSPIARELGEFVKNKNRIGSLHKHISPLVDPLVKNLRTQGVQVRFYEMIDGEFGVRLT